MAMLLLASPLFAENAVSDMEEVVVEDSRSKTFRRAGVSSATLIDVPAQEVPQSINVLTRDLLDARNTGSLDSALTYDSSVFSGGSSLYSRTSGQFSVRGFSGSDVMVQGMPLPSSMGTVLDTALVEDIEVVKGPIGSIMGGQSSTLGPYGAGGSIVLRMKQPELDSFTDIMAYARLNNGGQRYRMTLDDNRMKTIGESQFAFRNIVAADIDKPFWMMGGANWGQTYTVSPSMLYQPDSRTKIVAVTSFQYQDAPGYQGIPVLGGRFIGPYDSWPGGPRSRSRYKGGLAQVHGEWKLEKTWTIRSGLGVGVSDVDYNIWGLAAGSPNRGVSTLDYYDSVISTGMGNYEYAWSDVINTTWNFYTHAVAEFKTGKVGHEGLVGLDYTGRDTEGHSSFATTSERFSIYTPTYPAEGTRIYSSDTSSDTTLQRVGLTFQDFASWGSWRFLAGVRLDEHFSDEGHCSFKASPRAGISRYLGKHVVLFGNVSQTEAPNFGYKDADNREMTNSWLARQYETGVRVNPVRDLWFSASWFYIDQENTPEALPDDRTRYIADGESRSQGVELTLNGSITDSWSSYLSYTYLHYKDIDQRQTFDRFSPHTVALWQQYRISGEYFNGTTIGLGYRFTDKYYATLRGNKIADNYTIPSSSVFDLAIEIPLPESFVIPGSTLRLAVYNIFDKRYVASTRHAVQCFAGDPRTFEVCLRSRF